MARISFAPNESEKTNQRNPPESAAKAVGITPEQKLEERRSKLLHSVKIASISDISQLEDVGIGSCKVILEPIGEDIRSDYFIDSVILRCRELSLPVELRGSTLSHAYHQLLKAGVQVFTAEPGKKFNEVRQRKAYDKLVRDQIPDVIERGGELVRADELDPDDLILALVGKLFEEVEEFVMAKTTAARAEELSDLLEVVRGLSAASKVTFNEVTTKADEKAFKRGGFEKGVILRSTEISHRGPSEPELFDTTAGRKRVRLHTVKDHKIIGSGQDLSLPTLIKTGSREITLQVEDKAWVVIRVSIKSGTIHFEVRGIDRGQNDQPRLF